MLGMHNVYSSYILFMLLVVVLSRPSFMPPHPRAWLTCVQRYNVCPYWSIVLYFYPPCSVSRTTRRLRGGIRRFNSVLVIYTRYPVIVSSRQFHNMSYPSLLFTPYILWLSYRIQCFVYYVQFRPIFTEFLCKKFFILLNIFYAPQYVVV